MQHTCGALIHSIVVYVYTRDIPVLLSFIIYFFYIIIGRNTYTYRKDLLTQECLPYCVLRVISVCGRRFIYCVLLCWYFINVSQYIQER